MIHRFYWLIDGGLAGCSRPGETQGDARRQPGNGQLTLPLGDEVTADLFWLRQHAIGAILSLTETPLPPESITQHELATLHIPVPDVTAPFPVQIAASLSFIDSQRSSGHAVAVHCLQGQGRTGVILAAYLIREGLPAQQAIDRLRALCPGAIGVEEQERALHAFARRREWIL